MAQQAIGCGIEITDVARDIEECALRRGHSGLPYLAPHQLSQKREAVRSGDTDVRGHARKRPAARPSTIILAMRSASEVCGTRHEIGTKHLLSSDRRAKPAVESGLSSRSRPAKPRKKQIRKKKEGRRNADRRVVHDPRFGAARADRSALACRRSTTALAAANERRSSTPATRFL